MKVKVKNYGIVRSANIEFLPGLNVIKGESGAGKSTILRGIEGAVFNQSGDSFVTQGETDAEITIEHNGHVIQRMRNSSTSKYCLDGEELSKVGRTPVKEILNAFGIKEIKADSSTLRPNFLTQFSAPFLIDEKPSKIFEYLTITSSAINLKDVESEISNDLNTLKQQKKSKEETLVTLKKLILTSSKIIEKKSEITKLTSQLEAFNKKQSKTELLENVTIRTEDLTRLVKTQETKISKLENVLDKINSANIDYDKIHSQTTNINNLEKLIKNIEITKNNIAYLENSISTLESNSINIDQNKFENKFNQIKNLSLLMSDIESKQKAFNIIKENGVQLNKELSATENEITEFKKNNIPVIVVTTNDSLAESLKIERKDIVKILIDQENK